MRTLILSVGLDSIGSKVWMVEELGERAALIEHLFGTKKIPTAYMATMPDEKVRDAIKKLNPDADVIINHH
jgi:hypothetical protein